ncbi:MAG: hypothetical protein ACRDDY_14270, partial [Clostridium sp.]|uniref:hypothetical protein n=1 Tax=Clostridium sp. TaxID=1506 RepID=UPI003EE81EAB
MVYEEERRIIKKEEKYLTLFLILGILMGSIVGIYLENIILYFSVFGVVGVLMGSIFNMILRNRKISK